MSDQVEEYNIRLHSEVTRSGQNMQNQQGVKQAKLTSTYEGKSMQ